MNKREHFECWIKHVKPNMPLGYNEQEGYYYHDIASMMWQAWQASPRTRPTEPGKVTKEQLAELRKPNPETIVDRLRGIYPGIASAYPVTPLQREAADEIDRLRAAAEAAYDFLNGINTFWLNDEGVQELKAAEKNLRAVINKKPAEAG